MRSCPRCGVELFTGQAARVTMHACGRCGGVWLDKGDARLVREALPAEALRLAQSASQHGQGAADPHREAHCPTCRRAMHRMHISGVDIDECDEHGTWFDRGELEIVAEALKKARARAPVPPAGPPPGYAMPAGNHGPAPGPAAHQVPQGQRPQQGPGASPGRPGVGAGVALAGAAVGVVGVAALAHQQQQQQQQQAGWGEMAADAVDVGLDVADTGLLDLAADGAGAAGEAMSAVASTGAEAIGAIAESGAAEAAGGLLEGVFSLIGALFD